MRSTFPIPVVLLWAGATLLLPVLLGYSAWRTYQSLEEQRGVYLRSRTAQIASKLEIIPTSANPDEVLDSLDEGSGLLDVQILAKPIDPAHDSLARLWLGQELFVTQRITLSGRSVLRSFVPFHAGPELRIARIDLDEASSDFLVEHARHHLLFVGAASLVFMALSVLLAVSAGKLLRSQQRQAELEHLAHIGKMSAALAHEIRNPLGTIKGFAQLIQERSTDDQQKLIGPILSETSRLETLVKDLLLYGRPAQPVMTPTRTADVMEMLRPHLDQLPAQIALESRIADVTFESDQNLLVQALLNLVKNSAEALQGTANPSIRIVAQLIEGRVIWQVIDNGPGFSDEARDRMFEAFYTTKAFGTGLGLSITRKLVESLGGSLSVHNETTVGTRAEVELPLKRS